VSGAGGQAQRTCVARSAVARSARSGRAIGEWPTGPYPPGHTLTAVRCAESEPTTGRGSLILSRGTLRTLCRGRAAGKGLLLRRPLESAPPANNRWPRSCRRVHLACRSGQWVVRPDRDQAGRGSVIRPQGMSSGSGGPELPDPAPFCRGHGAPWRCLRRRATPLLGYASADEPRAWVDRRTGGRHATGLPSRSRTLCYRPAAPPWMMPERGARAPRRLISQARSRHHHASARRSDSWRVMCDRAH
jgi:hypothetical protein